MHINLICLDLDDVLADFVCTALRFHHRLDALDNWPVPEWDIAKVLGMSQEEFWNPLRFQMESFSARLPVFPWATNLVDFCTELAPMAIVTSPRYSDFSATGKRIWVRENFPELLDGMFICCQKERLATPDRVLIDDNPEGVRAFQQAGGRGILFPQPWNTPRDKIDWQDRCATVRRQLWDIVHRV
jgi:5'(3')-deoxyribonucleotidase